MKYIDEIYPFDINSTIGPTGTIKRLFRNRIYFEECGFSMTIFALLKNRNKGKKKLFLSEIKVLEEEKNVSRLLPSINKSSLISLLKSRKHAFVESNYITSALAFWRSKRSNARFVKSYLALERKPDVVVFHDPDSCYHYLKYRNSRFSKVVVFIHADGSDDEMFLKRKPTLKGKKEHQIMKTELLYTYQNSDCIVWISEIAKKRFCNNHPEYAHKTCAVVNGINDISSMTSQGDNMSPEFNYRLVTTGTVCERKGQYIIVEAMRRMDSKLLAKTHLTIIGTGPDHSRLVNLAERYGLSNHITFTGNVPNSEIPRYLAKENIYILMSNNEGLPISILEAMRAGLPVISTRIAGIPEEVDERNGILIEPDIEQLTSVLNSLSKYDWTALGKVSRQRFEKEFTFDIMSRKYADMLGRLFN